MKKVLAILLIGCISFTINAQEKKAKMEFKTEVIDYGTIEKGADGTRIFEFTNVGDAPLIITKVNSTCGCTVPEWPKDAILPGESGQIKVIYNTRRVMPIRKTVSVVSNAERPYIPLKIKGNVIDPEKEQTMEKKDKSMIEQ